MRKGKEELKLLVKNIYDVIVDVLIPLAILVIAMNKFLSNYECSWVRFPVRPTFFSIY